MDYFLFLCLTVFNAGLILFVRIILKCLKELSQSLEGSGGGLAAVMAAGGLPQADVLSIFWPKSRNAAV